MKKTVTKEIEVCERCGIDIDSTYGKLKYVCPMCKKIFCSGCKFGVMEKYPDLCVDCANIPEIKERKEKFIDDYWKRYYKEEENLKSLKLQ